MARFINEINSLDDLQAYVLRSLGGDIGIIVELSKGQMDDRFDDTLQLYNKYHMEGYSSTYALLNVEIGTSVYTLDDDIIAVPYIIQKVNEILSEPSFSIQWEYLNEKRWIGDIDLIGFELLMEKMKMIDVKFRLSNGFAFNATTHIFEIFSSILQAETWALKVYKANDPYSYPDIFNDEWIKKYYKAICQYQWAQNLSKYTNVPLPGGSTLNVSELKREAKEDMKDLREELEKRFQEPIDIIIG